MPSNVSRNDFSRIGCTLKVTQVGMIFLGTLYATHFHKYTTRTEDYTLGSNIDYRSKKFRNTDEVQG